MQTEVELGDFVEEKRAAMGHFHAPWFRSVGPGEGSFFVSEELAFEQRARNRRAVDFHERTISPGRKAVDHACDDVFASAALALNQDGNVGARYFIHAVPKRLHDLSAAKCDRIGRKLSQRSSQRTNGRYSRHEYLVAQLPLRTSLVVHPESQTPETPEFGL